MFTFVLQDYGFDNRCCFIIDEQLACAVFLHKHNKIMSKDQLVRCHDYTVVNLLLKTVFDYERALCALQHISAILFIFPSEEKFPFVFQLVGIMKTNIKIRHRRSHFTWYLLSIYKCNIMQFAFSNKQQLTPLLS